MVVTSNGINTSYQVASDNARLIAEYKVENSLVINVNNPTDGIFRDLVESVKGQFGQQQSVQVAIQNQMKEALSYNAGMIAVQGKLGNTIAPFLTEFIGHSQGTINGNRAISGMDKADKLNIRAINIGTYAAFHPEGLGDYVNFTDKGDGARFFSGWMDRDPRFHTQNQNLYWTDMGDIGNNHSLYLYLQLKEVQQKLGLRTQADVFQNQPFPNKR